MQNNRTKKMILKTSKDANLTWKSTRMSSACLRRTGSDGKIQWEEEQRKERTGQQPEYGDVTEISKANAYVKCTYRGNVI